MNTADSPPLPHCRFLDLAQGSAAWLAYRRLGVGGSDLPAILGISPHADHNWGSVLQEKLTGESHFESFAMRRGQRLESIARAAYIAEYEIEIRPTCCELVEAPQYRASLDGYYEDERGGLVVEIKALGWQAHDSLIEGLVLDHLHAQVQWQLFVTGAKLAHLVGYNDSKRYSRADQLVLVPLKPCAEWQGRLVEAAENFWLAVLEHQGRAMDAKGGA